MITTANPIATTATTAESNDPSAVNLDQSSETLQTKTLAPAIAFPTASSIAEKNAQPVPALVQSIVNADASAAKAAVLDVTNSAQQLAQQAAQQTAQRLTSAVSLIAQSIGSGSEQLHLAQKAALSDCRARVRQRPVTSLLIAAAFGYAFCLLRRAAK